MRVYGLGMFPATLYEGSRTSAHQICRRNHKAVVHAKSNALNNTFQGQIYITVSEFNARAHDPFCFWDQEHKARTQQHRANRIRKKYACRPTSAVRKCHVWDGDWVQDTSFSIVRFSLQHNLLLSDWSTAYQQASSQRKISLRRTLNAFQQTSWAWSYRGASSLDSRIHSQALVWSISARLWKHAHVHMQFPSKSQSCIPTLSFDIYWSNILLFIIKHLSTMILGWEVKGFAFHNQTPVHSEVLPVKG